MYDYKVGFSPKRFLCKIKSAKKWELKNNRTGEIIALDIVGWMKERNQLAVSSI